jgi:hypothetical protein
MSGIDGDGDGSNGCDGLLQVGLRALLDVDKSGACGTDVLLLEQAFTPVSRVRI